LKNRFVRMLAILLAALGVLAMQPSAPATASTNYHAGYCYPNQYGSGNTAIFRVTGWRNANGTRTFHYSIRSGYKVVDGGWDPRFYWYGSKSGYGSANYYASEWYATLGGVTRATYHTGIWNKYTAGIYLGRVSCNVLLPIN
jgi:hypothetical protein